MSVFATKIDMCNTLEAWSKETFGQAFNKLNFTAASKDYASLALLKHVIETQKLWNKKMMGNCSQGLIKTDEENLNIWFSLIVNPLEDADQFWTPLDYLHSVCKHMLNDKTGYEKMAASDRFNCDFNTLCVMICGRALRNLPSFIREYQQRNAIVLRFPDGTFEKDVKLDMQGHCDLQMFYKGVEYRFWSYQSTKRGLYNFEAKFAQKRGSIANCMHVLCPIDTFTKANVCDYLGWRMYSKKRIDDICNLILDDKAIVYSTLDFDETDFSVPMLVKKTSRRAYSGSKSYN